MNSEIGIAVYRTEKNPTYGAQYYRVSSFTPEATGNNGWVDNSVTAFTVSFSDKMSDTELIRQEADYQNTGELDNVQASACNVLAAAKGRLAVAGGDVAPQSVQLSKLPAEGFMLGFNDALSERVDQPSGDVTALAQLGDSLIVFKRGSTWALSGDGPDNLGQGFWAQPTLVSLDVGCTEPRSVVQTPIGIMFKSAKGIYSIGQNGLSYIGADVEGYNANDVTSATLWPDKNHVIFGSSTGTSLVYDYLYNQWSTFSNHYVAAATRTSDTYYFVDTSGQVKAHRDDYYLDGQSPYTLRMVTNWLRLDKLQDFFRVRKISLLGTYRTSHTMTVRIFNDYEEAYTDSFSFTPKTPDNDTTLMENASWGGGSWGDEYWGSNDSPGLGGVYQFQDRLSRQKTQSVKIEFYDSIASPVDSDSVVESGRGYELQAISLEVGRKSGLFRVHDRRKV